MKLMPWLFLAFSVALCGAFLAGIIFLSKIIYQNKSDILPLSQQYQNNFLAATQQNSKADSLEGEEFSILWETADAQRGARIFQQCLMCHTVEKGGRQGVGPNLYGVYGRSPAQVKSFPYSQAMRNFAKKQSIWDKDSLNHYLEAPRKLIAGTSMAFFGIVKAKDRADLIRYLETL